MLGSNSTQADHHHHRHLRDDHPMMDDGDDGVVESQGSSGVSCSICLETVAYHRARSRAVLQCGHEFHLDCIGSAFNMKGAMQCPNCRKVERGQWLYANESSRSIPEASIEDLIHEDDLYNLNYPEMPFRVQWCPFDELARVGASMEVVESQQTAYHDLQGPRPMFAEHTPVSSVSHSYVAYVEALAPAASRSNDSVDSSNLNHHWNTLSSRNEAFNPHAVNVQYHGWGRHSPPFSITGTHIAGADSIPVPSATLRSTPDARDILNMHGSYPVLLDYGSGPRNGSSFVTSLAPRQSGSSARAHERVPVSRPFHHQQQASNTAAIPSPMVPGMRRGLPTVMPPTQHPDQNSGFYIFPSTSATQHQHEVENLMHNHFHGWERESGWGSHHATSSSDFSNWSNEFWIRRRS